MINKLNVLLYFIMLITYYYAFVFYRPIQELLFYLDSSEFYYFLKITSLSIFSISFLFLFNFSYKLKYPKYTVIYITYTIFNIVYLILYLKYPINYVFTSFYGTLGIFFLSFFFLLTSSINIRLKTISRTIGIFLTIVFVFSLFFATLQYIYQSTLMYSDETHFYISIHDTIQQIRATSFFPGGIFDKFMAIVGILMISFILNGSNKYKVFAIIILILSLYGIFLSTVRSSLILLFFAAFNLYLLKTRLKFRKIVFINILLSILIPVALLSFSITYNLDSTFLRTNSIVDRVFWWQHIINQYIENGNIINIIFGYGIVQNTTGDINSPVIDGYFWIDNLYLTLYLYHGVIGLLLFLLFYINLISQLYTTYKNSVFYYFLIATSLAWLVEGVFTRTIGSIALFTLIPIYVYLKINHNIMIHTTYPTSQK